MAKLKIRPLGDKVLVKRVEAEAKTAGGIVLRTDVGSISVYGRATSGVKMIDLADSDMLVSIASHRNVGLPNWMSS